MTRVLMEPYQIKLASQILNPKQDLSEANISINIDDALKKLASDQAELELDNTGFQHFQSRLKNLLVQMTKQTNQGNILEEKQEANQKQKLKEDANSKKEETEKTKISKRRLKQKTSPPFDFFGTEVRFYMRGRQKTST